MTSSIVNLCNRALGLIGSRATIAALDERSNEADRCGTFFESTRDELLGKGWWNFATKTEQLTLTKAAPGTPESTDPGGPWYNNYPAPPWLYEYAYPPDCVSARYISKMVDATFPSVPIFGAATVYYTPRLDQDVVKFQSALGIDLNNTQVRVILTNQPAAILTYICRVDDPGLWDEEFTDTFVVLLAGYIAGPLTGDLKLATSLMQAARAKLNEALASDANEGMIVADHVPDWLQIRGVTSNDSTVNVDGRQLP